MVRDGVGPRLAYNVTVAQFDPDGQPLDAQRIHNLVGLPGKNVVRDLLGRANPGTGNGYAPSHVALGIGGNQTTETQGGLNDETYRDAITSRGGFDAKLRFDLFLSTAQGNGNTFVESGLFDNAATNTGNMLARAIFTPVVKTSSIQLVVTWEITISSV